MTNDNPTRAEILSATPEKLRLWVAEHLMGWKWKNAGSGIKWLVDAEGIIGAALQKGAPNSITSFLPNFPAEIGAAWLVVCEMERRGFWCRVQTPFMPSEKAGNSDMYFAGFTPHATTGWNGVPDFWTPDTTLPSAIIRAALLAQLSAQAEQERPTP